MALKEQLITVDEFEAYENDHPDQLLELIDGRIVEKVTTEQHGVIAAWLIIEIGIYLRSHPEIKGHLGTEISHRRPDDKRNERRPDVSFRLTDDPASTASALHEMPDLAVEVKSPTNSYDELREKAKFYIANGTKLVWLIYPEKEIVEVYFADGSSELYNSQDTLDASAVLPKFTLQVQTIFEQI